jgi:hypothetical protein
VTVHGSPTRSPARLLRVAWSGGYSALIGIGLVLAATALAGCDTGTSKSESAYRALTGQWEIVSLRVSGVSYTTETNERYDTLRFAFADTTSGREYRLDGVKNDRAILGASGRVRIVNSRQLALTTGLPEPVVLNYDITQSRRATLTVPPGPGTGADGLLDTVLPQGSWAEAQSIELRLERL